ncbi:hypothetical protein SCHPADRAFT_439906 [Schizopora paradoxa]|uniref:DUF6533 domain-containing protein n=1 Tax=Schizopora paradoxa TaxID=27342 RepID=A0A0H2RJL8_9AGAM|nr:hypothetical protein SCHPADRAFT_439906 [Schizopora paradoxa]
MELERREGLLNVWTGRMTVSGIDVVLELLRKLLMAKSLNAASAAIYFYDSLLNFEDEVTLIWRKRWNIGTVMYLATRYLVLIDITVMLVYLFHANMNPETCHTVYSITTYFAFGGIILAEIILAMRTYALWKRSKIILAILLVVHLGTDIPDTWLTIESVNALRFSPSLVPTLIPCLPNVPKTKMFIPFINLMVQEAVMTFLAFLAAINHWRHTNSPLIKTIYRDGTLYFVCLLLISTVNVVIFTVQSLNIYYDLLIELQRILHSILSARIILNMRKVASNTASQEFPKFRVGGRIPNSQATDESDSFKLDSFHTSKLSAS